MSDTSVFFHFSKNIQSSFSIIFSSDLYFGCFQPLVRPKYCFIARLLTYSYCKGIHFFNFLFLYFYSYISIFLFLYLFSSSSITHALVVLSQLFMLSYFERFFTAFASLTVQLVGSEGRLKFVSFHLNSVNIS